MIQLHVWGAHAPLRVGRGALAPAWARKRERNGVDSTRALRTARARVLPKSICVVPA